MVKDLTDSKSFEKRYLVNDTQNENKTKILIKLSSSNINKEDLTQILKETIILSRIKSGSLIQNVLSYFIEKKQLFVVMNNFQEKTLNDLLMTTNTLSSDLKYRWCKDLTFAMDYLHMHNQAHLKAYTKYLIIILFHLF